MMLSRLSSRLLTVGCLLSCSSWCCLFGLATAAGTKAQSQQQPNEIAIHQSSNPNEKDDRSRFLQGDLACEPGLEQLATIEEYYLLELFGAPGQVGNEELDDLESSFYSSWNMTAADCVFSSLQVTFLADAVDGYVKNVDDGPTDFDSSSERAFNFFMMIQAQYCEPAAQICDIPSSIFSSAETLEQRRKRRLEEERLGDDADSTSGSVVATVSGLRRAAVSSSSSSTRRQRNLQGETSGCLLETCNPPTLAAFLATWEKETVSPSFEIRGMVSVSLTEGCLLTSFGKFASQVYVTVRHDSLSAWTDSMLSEIAQLFVQSYNQMNLLNPELCDPQKRQLTNSSAQVVELSANNSILQLYVAGSCLNCDTSTSLFDYNRTLAENQRNLQAEEVAAACLCPNITNSTMLRAPTQAEFALEFQTAMEGGDLSLVLVEEFNSVLCQEPLIDFEATLFVAYQAVCSFLDESEIILLETSILESYNALTDNDYCDPFFHTLTNVSNVAIGNITDDGQLMLEFLVTGTCRGCNSTQSSIFDESNSTAEDDLTSQILQSAIPSSSSRSRSLSEECACPINAFADRAPTEDEFLELYETVVVALSVELLCVTTIFGGEVATEPPTMAPTEVEQNCTIDLSTTITSHIAVELNVTATGMTLLELGASLLNFYNVFINETYSTCQTAFYRQIQAVSVAGVNEGTMNGRQLQDPNENAEIILKLEGACADCDPAGLFFDPGVLSQEDFVGNYSETVDIELEFFSEIVDVPCPPNTTTFEDFVIVEFIADCVLFLNDSELVQQLEDAYVSSYNDLSRYYCDPYSRQIGEAKITLVGETNALGNIPVEMRLVGSCESCDGLDISVYDVPTSVSESRRLFDSSSFSGGRSLQGTCTCPAWPIGERALYEAEFVEAYQQTVDSLNLECVSSVEECKFGTSFQTGIFVEFAGSKENITDAILQEIANTFKESVNEEYRTNTTQCNPEFRVAESVEASLVNGESRRLLQHHRRSVRALQAPSPSVAPSDSMTPSESMAPSFSMENTPGSSSPTFQLDPASVDILLYVYGVCNGCENDVTLTDQTVDTRRGRDLQVGGMSDTHASLATSNCYCRIGAVIDAIAPSSTMLQITFANYLADRGIPNEIRDFGELPVIDCNAPILQFTTTFRYLIELRRDVQWPEVQALAEVFKSTYNNLISSYCDPFDRRMDQLYLRGYSELESAESGCSVFEVRFAVLGNCRGCFDGTVLFDPENFGMSTVQRKLLHSRTLEAGGSLSGKRTGVKRRQLQTGQECFCQGDTIADRAPSTGEFDNAFADVLDTLGFVNLCGIVAQQHSAGGGGDPAVDGGGDMPPPDQQGPWPPPPGGGPTPPPGVNPQYPPPPGGGPTPPPGVNPQYPPPPGGGPTPPPGVNPQYPPPPGGGPTPPPGVNPQYPPPPGGGPTPPPGVNPQYPPPPPGGGPTPPPGGFPPGPPPPSSGPQPANPAPTPKPNPPPTPPPAPSPTNKPAPAPTPPPVPPPTNKPTLPPVPPPTNKPTPPPVPPPTNKPTAPPVPPPMPPPPPPP